MKRKVLLPYLQITGAMIIVGSNIVAGKLISQGFPLFLASSLRFALASALIPSLTCARALSNAQYAWVHWG